MSDEPTYRSPLGERYASQPMRALFSQERRILEWRRLWLALARAERELGLPIEESQIQQLEARLIREALQKAGGNKAQTARDLQMPLRTLAYKIKAYELER